MARSIVLVFVLVVVFGQAGYATTNRPGTTVTCTPDRGDGTKTCCRGGTCVTCKSTERVCAGLDAKVQSRSRQ